MRDLWRLVSEISCFHLPFGLSGKHHNSFWLASCIFPAQKVSCINLAEPSKAPKMATLPCRALVFSSRLLAPSLKSVWFSSGVLLAHSQNATPEEDNCANFAGGFSPRP